MLVYSLIFLCKAIIFTESIRGDRFSSVFIFFEAFRLTLVKKNRQNEESRENVALYRK